MVKTIWLGKSTVYGDELGFFRKKLTPRRGEERWRNENSYAGKRLDGAYRISSTAIDKGGGDDNANK